MARVLIVSGVPGVGKSTVSLQLANGLKKSAYINGDLIYHQVVGGYNSPWSVNNHLKLFYDILICSTNLYLEQDFDVIIDYFLDFEDFLFIRNGINCNDVKFVFLVADKKVILERDSKREKEKIMGQRVIDAIDEFELSNVPVECIIDTTNIDVKSVTLKIKKKYSFFKKLKKTAKNSSFFNFF